MRNAFRLMLAAAAVVAPAIAHAQVMRGGDPSDGLPRPQDIRPMGVQMRSGSPAFFEGDQCGRWGCIIVINRSAAFDVAQFYLNDGKLDAHGVPVWGANQFKGFSLHSNRAVWTPKPRKMRCEVLVRVVMRQRDTEREVEGVQPFDLCNMPKRGFAVIELQAEDPNARGRVILDDGPGS